MHSTGAAPGLTWVPHTVDGATGAPGGPAPVPADDELPDPGELLELLSDAPRMTPAATSAAPTVAQPTQAMWVLTHRQERRASRHGSGPVLSCWSFRT